MTDHRDPCRCWHHPIDAPLMPHDGHCCLREDTTPCQDIGPTTPCSCGHFVADSPLGRAQERKPPSEENRSA